MNIVYSNAVKQNFKEFSSSYQLAGEDPAMQVASREKAQAIHDIVTAVIGAYQSAAQVNIYTMDGSCVEAGYWMRTSTVDLDSISWYPDTLSASGHKYFTPPITREELPAKGSNQRSQKFISMTRLFFDSADQPEGIVEVIQDCDKIFSLASQMETTNPDSNVYIYNSRKELVYPYSRNVHENLYSMMEEHKVAEGEGKMVAAENGNQMLYTWQQIPEYDWTVILTKPKSEVYASLRNFQSMFLAIAVLSIACTLVICFWISRKLTQPLEKLSDAAGKITISRVLDQNKVNLTSADSSITEIAKLCESIRAMYEKLRSTTQEYLLAQSEETRAKLQATQSLINPHFLYNCLTNMSIMAEEEMNDDIILMCQALCDYFRYISSSQQMIVPLEEEIFYTERYLECMKLRFGEEFEYTLDVAKDTSQLCIPKLILQPLVENAFKYAFNMSPPWKLKITSHLDGNRWILEVMDNGAALSEAKKKELLETFRNLDMNEELKSMKIGGMGLKNVYLRLRLLYGQDAIFQIENTIPQKTIFILGGPICRSKEEYHEHYPQL